MFPSLSISRLAVHSELCSSRSPFSRPSSFVAPRTTFLTRPVIPPLAIQRRHSTTHFCLQPPPFLTMRTFPFSLLAPLRSSNPSVSSRPQHLRPTSITSSTYFARCLRFLFILLRYALLALVLLVLSYSLFSRTPLPPLSVAPHHADYSDELDYESEYDPMEDAAHEDREMPYEAYIDIYVRNADQDQPLLQSMDNALPQDEFDRLQACLRDHPMRHSNVNDDNTFKGTKGFLLSFNDKGVQSFTEHESFKCLAPYFRAHMLPNANAWVLNMVWAEIPDYTRELAIQRHTDDAIVVEFEGSKKIMPFQTNVLYVFVPPDMVGGELEAWPYEITYADVGRGPEARVTPVENRMAYFRGDAQHQVRSYNTSSTSVLRGSLVLEQYVVPEEYREMVTEFHWRDNDGSDMM